MPAGATPRVRRFVDEMAAGALLEYAPRPQDVRGLESKVLEEVIALRSSLTRPRASAPAGRLLEASANERNQLMILGEVVTYSDKRNKRAAPIGMLRAEARVIRDLCEAGSALATRAVLKRASAIVGKGTHGEFGARFVSELPADGRARKPVRLVFNRDRDLKVKAKWIH